jgi:hypothetical protein
MMCLSWVKTPPSPSLLTSTEMVNTFYGSATFKMGVVVNNSFNLLNMS